MAAAMGAAELLEGDVGGELDDLKRLSVSPEDRVVAGFDPYVLASLADAVELAGAEVAAAQGMPEFDVVSAAGELLVAEHAVGIADELLEGVAEDVEEVLVGVEDISA